MLCVFHHRPNSTFWYHIARNLCSFSSFPSLSPPSISSRGESSVGAKRDRLIAQGHLIYPTAQSIIVHLQVDDLHGISSAVMFAAGFLGIVYVVLQNGIILEEKEREGKLWRWFAWIVRLVNSARGHLILLVCAVVLWVGTIVTTAMAIWIALNREQNVKMYVDGVKLTQQTVE